MRHLLMLAVLTALASCDGDSTPSLTGGWTGSQSGHTIVLDLEETSEKVDLGELGGIVMVSVDGEGSASGTEYSVSIRMEGFHEHPAVNLLMAGSGYFMTFEGQFGDNPDVISGELDGVVPGFATVDSISFTLVRQGGNQSITGS